VVTNLPERAVPHDPRTVSGHPAANPVVPLGQFAAPFRAHGGKQRRDDDAVSPPQGADTQRQAYKVTLLAADLVQIGPADPDEFGRVYADGFGFPAGYRDAMAVSVQVLAGRPDVRLYRARVSAGTAGVALLFLGGKTGYLATAATLPGYRRQGVHSALARQRIHDASLAGCDLIVGHAAVGSASQRSMERCGLRLAYTKAIWSTP
jgi:hypothetical protein